MTRINPTEVMGDTLSEAELHHINNALNAGREWGYGNIMAWLATEWAVILRDKHGFSNRDAVEAVSGRTPYPLPNRKEKHDN